MNGILRSTWFAPALVASTLAIAHPAQAVEQAPPPPADYVAHEWGTFTSMARQLGAAVMQGLVQQGLFVDEARAMVATWSRSWFQKDGARVIYVLPREQVDAVLPLHLVPRPKELVRVLVGRLEFITPEAQARVEQAVRDRSAGDGPATARADAVFQSLDRFLEPHLRNVAQHGSDPGLRRAATMLLAEPPR